MKNRSSPVSRVQPSRAHWKVLFGLPPPENQAPLPEKRRISTDSSGVNRINALRSPRGAVVNQQCAPLGPKEVNLLSSSGGRVHARHRIPFGLRGRVCRLPARDNPRGRLAARPARCAKVATVVMPSTGAFGSTCEAAKAPDNSASSRPDPRRARALGSEEDANLNLAGYVILGPIQPSLLMRET
jgi:hypothetical protein